MAPPGMEKAPALPADALAQNQADPHRPADNIPARGAPQ